LFSVGGVVETLRNRSAGAMTLVGVVRRLPRSRDVVQRGRSVGLFAVCGHHDVGAALGWCRLFGYIIDLACFH